VSRAFLTIRRGTRRDAPVIVALIRGLADYERLAHQLKVTPARVRRHGFGRRRYFETLICRRGQTPIGFALYFFTYSTFLAAPTLYLEDLFVLPAERGQGAGRALLVALARIAIRRRCGRMEWAVLDWNAPAIGFYERLGAGLRREWILTRLSGAALRRLAAARSRRAPRIDPRQVRASPRRFAPSGPNDAQRAHREASPQLISDSIRRPARPKV
jgi:GNAT superfamily N-acetyltransferase